MQYAFLASTSCIFKKQTPVFIYREVALFKIFNGGEIIYITVTGDHSTACGVSLRRM